MTTDVTDVIAQAIATAQVNDMTSVATAAAEAFAAALHAHSAWKPEGNVIDTLTVKLLLDTSEAEATVSALEKRMASLVDSTPIIVNSSLVGAIPIGSPTRAEYAAAARKWADEVTSDVIFGLPPLPDLLLRLVAIRSDRQ